LVENPLRGWYKTSENITGLMKISLFFLCKQGLFADKYEGNCN
jgi:hypothetical protein